MIVMGHWHRYFWTIDTHVNRTGVATRCLDSQQVSLDRVRNRDPGRNGSETTQCMQTSSVRMFNFDDMTSVSVSVTRSVCKLHEEVRRAFIGEALRG